MLSINNQTGLWDAGLVESQKAVQIGLAMNHTSTFRCKNCGRPVRRLKSKMRDFAEDVPDWLRNIFNLAPSLRGNKYALEEVKESQAEDPLYYLNCCFCRDMKLQGRTELITRRCDRLLVELIMKLPSRRTTTPDLFCYHIDTILGKKS